MVKKSSSSKSTKSNSSETVVKFLRLTNGEDIVAGISDVTDTSVTITNPLKVVYSASVNPGYLTMSLMQWVFLKLSTNQTFELPTSQILIQSIPEDSLLEHYNKSVGVFRSAGNKGYKFLGDDVDVDIEDDEGNTLDDSEGLELLKSLMEKMKGGKGKLH